MQTNPPTQPSLIQFLESAPIAILAVDGQGKIVFVNRRLEALFGYEPDELNDQLIEQLIPTRFHRDHQRHIRDYMKQPRMRTMGSGMDLAGVRKDGSEFSIEVGLSPMQIGERKLVLGLVTDITYRKQIEEMLEQRVEERTREIERRRSVAEGLRYILAVLNSNQTLEKTLEYVVMRASDLLDANACILYRFDRDTDHVQIQATEQFSLSSVEQMHHLIGEAEDGQNVATKQTVMIPNIAARAKADIEPTKWDALLLEGYRSLLSVQLLVKDEIYGGLTLYYAKPREFSAEEIQIAMAFSDQAALAIENDRLRSQVEQVAVAAERNRIARDLHDSVSQTLFSANLIAEVLPRLWEVNPEQGKKSASELLELTRGAQAEMRTLLFELRPHTLREVPLVDLLQQLKDALVARERIPVSLTVTGAGTLSVEVKTAFFYIAQEALNNIAKHARASQVIIELLIQPNLVRLLIQDDGRGFDPSTVPSDHIGLRIMHERIEEVHGTIIVESKIEQGTTILVTWSNS